MKKHIVLKILLSVLLLFLSGCESGGQDVDDHGSGYLGPFEVKEENGILDLPMFGMKIILPESFEFEDFTLSARGYVQEQSAYTILSMLDDDGNQQNWDLFKIYADRDTIHAADYADEKAGITEQMIHDLGSSETFHYAALNYYDIYKVNPGYIEDTILSEMPDEYQSLYLALLSRMDDIYEGITLTEFTFSKPDSDGSMTADPGYDPKAEKDR